MNTYIDLAYEFYEDEKWELAKKIIIKEQSYEDNPLALNLMGSIFSKLGDNKNAKKYYLQAIKCQREFWPAYFNLGNLYHSENKYNKAIKQYMKSLLYKRDHFKIYYNIGTCYLKNKDVEVAIDYLKEAINQKPTHLQSNINLAKAYYVKGDFKKAFIYYNSSLAIDGENANAIKGHGKTWEKLIH